MTQEQRIRAVVDCSFTERQDRFLVLVTAVLSSQDRNRDVNDPASRPGL